MYILMMIAEFQALVLDIVYIAGQAVRLFW